MKWYNEIKIYIFMNKSKIEWSNNKKDDFKGIRLISVKISRAQVSIEI